MHSCRPGNEIRSLAILAREFIERVKALHYLGNTNDGRDLNYLRLSQAILHREDVTEDPYASYRNILQMLKATVNHELVQQLENVVNAMMENVRQSATVSASAVANVEIAESPVHQSKETTEMRTNERSPTLPSDANQSTVDQQPCLGQKPRKQVFGDFDIDRSCLGKDIAGEEKLQFMITTWQQCQIVEKRLYSNAFRTFESQTLRPLMLCFVKHFQGDHASFLIAWTKKKCKHRLFGKDICSGRDQCRMSQDSVQVVTSSHEA